MKEIKDLTPNEETVTELTVDDLMKEIGSVSKLALLKEEDNVIRSLIRGTSRVQVLKDLQLKYPKEKLLKRDLDEFIVLYKDVLYNEKTDLEKAYVRRLVKSQTGLTNELINLALKAKDMADRYDSAGDSSNAVGALRAASDIFMKFAKVQGLATDQPEVNINMKMDRVVAEVTSDDSEFKKKLMQFVNKKEEKVVDVEVDGIN